MLTSLIPLRLPAGSVYPDTSILPIHSIERVVLCVVAILSLWLALPATLLRADYVSLNNGQGWVFQHRGNCYLLTPEHVVNSKKRLRFSTETPVFHGEATVMRNFKTVHDLALAFVTPGMEQRCRTSLQDIPSDLSNSLTVGNRVTLAQVRSSGLVESVEGTILAFDAYKIYFKPFDADGLFQGRSGGALLQNGQFIGMAIEAEGTDIGIFLRADEIRDNMRGIIDRAASSVKYSAAPVLASECDLPVGKIAAVRCSAPAISDEHSCSGLINGNAALFSADSIPLTIEFTMGGEELTRISRLSLIPEKESNDDITHPKSIMALIDTSSGERRRWRRFAVRDTAPDGSVSLLNGSKPAARHIKLIVQSSWAPELPVQIPCLFPE